MASCITSQVGNSYCPQLKLVVEVDSSYSSNATKAKLDWKLQYVAHGYAVSTSASKSYTAVINGTTVASGSYAIGGKTQVNNIATGSVYIDRGTASKSISFSCSMNFGITWHGSSLGNKSASGSITLSAKTSYTVSYNVNGGSGSISAQTKWHGTNLTLSTTKPTKTGHSFKNWNTNSGGTGTAYSSGGTYSANASATLYAQYTANTYTISYNANGGSGAPASHNKTYGVNTTISSTKPTRTNYNFKGWATSATGGVAYASGATYSANSSITLYAVWELAYKKPRITNLSVTRCNSSGTASDEGAYAKVVFSWATDKTVTSVKVGYKTSGASSYTYTTLSGSGTSGSVSQVIGGSLSNTSEYLFDIVVADGSGTTYTSNATRSIPAMAFVVDFASGGKGMAIGCPADTTQNLLNIAWQTKLGGGSYVHRVNSTGGTGGYVKVATIVITNSYADSGIHMKLIQRGDTYGSTLYIRFNGADTVDPTVSEFRCGGRFCNTYLVKKATSTWDLYVEKNGTYGSVGVVEYETDFVYMRGKMNITWVNNELITDITTVVNSNATYTKALWGESPYLYQSDVDFVVGSTSRRMYFGSNAVPVVNQNGTTYTILHSGYGTMGANIDFNATGLGLKAKSKWLLRQDSDYNVILSCPMADTGGTKGSIYFRPQGTSDSDVQMILDQAGNLTLKGGGYTTSDTAMSICINNAKSGTESKNVIKFRTVDDYTYFNPTVDNLIRLGSTSYRWSTCYSAGGVSTSSDRTLKENIQYLPYDNINSRVKTDDAITVDDCLDFIINDYLLATYNYIADETKETKLSAIAQDIIVNEDGSDNKIGQLVVNCEEIIDENGTLGMNQTQLLNVAIGSIQALNKKVEEQQAIIEQQQKMIDELMSAIKKD